MGKEESMDGYENVDGRYKKEAVQKSLSSDRRRGLSEKPV